LLLRRRRHGDPLPSFLPLPLVSPSSRGSRRDLGFPCHQSRVPPSEPSPKIEK
jgi:hypothetical protein